MQDDIEYPNWFLSVEHNFIKNLSSLKFKKIKCLQIGAYTGNASVWLHNNIILDPESFLIDVDIWSENSEELQNMLELGKSLTWSGVESEYDRKTKDGQDQGKIIKYKGSSDDFFKDNVNFYDFVYIDGAHTAKQVEIDADNAWKFLNPLGIIAFDDYRWNHGSDLEKRPKVGIDRFLNKHVDEYVELNNGWQYWIMKK